MAAVRHWLDDALNERHRAILPHGECPVPTTERVARKGVFVQFNTQTRRIRDGQKAIPQFHRFLHKVAARRFIIRMIFQY